MRIIEWSFFFYFVSHKCFIAVVLCQLEVPCKTRLEILEVHVKEKKKMMKKRLNVSENEFTLLYVNRRSQNSRKMKSLPSMTV